MANPKTNGKVKRCSEIVTDVKQAHSDYENAMTNCTKKNLANCEEKFEDKKEFVDEMASDFIKNGCDKSSYPSEYLDDLKKKKKV